MRYTFTPAQIQQPSMRCKKVVHMRGKGRASHAVGLTLLGSYATPFLLLMIDSSWAQTAAPFINVCDARFSQTLYWHLPPVGAPKVLLPGSRRFVYLHEKWLPSHPSHADLLLLVHVRH